MCNNVGFDRQCTTRTRVRYVLNPSPDLLDRGLAHHNTFVNIKLTA